MDSSEGYGNGSEYAGSHQNRGPPAKRSRGDDPRGLADFLDRKDEKLTPNHILLITVRDPKYPINVEVIYKVCSIVGPVKKIVCFERNAVVQSMVEFDTLESASKARNTLHGCDIYNNCCTMRVEYSKMESLKVKGENGPMSWDFTRERGEEMGDDDKRPVILNEPGMRGGAGAGMGGQGGPDFMSGMRSMDMMGSMGGGQGMGGQGGMGGMRGQGGMGGPGPDMMGMGGPGGMGMRGPGMGPRGGYDMMGGGPGYGGGCCVVVVHNLAVGEVNCDRLFNLVCQYGNVNKIFFMKNKEGCAMIEMSDPDAAMRLVSNIQGVEIFGEKLKVELSKKHARITNPPLEWELPDGTSSVKDYSSATRLNRFTTPEMARKNRILAPTKVLHFYGIPKVSDSEVMDVFSQYCAPAPNKIKWVEPKRESQTDFKAGVGLAYFDSVQEATEALILVNHRNIEERTIKLCFSPATY